MTARATKAEAQKVLTALKKHFKSYTLEFATNPDGTTNYDKMVPVTNPDYLPVLVKGWDDPNTWYIVWESGSPYGWPTMFPRGGYDHDTGATYTGTALDEGIWTEAVNGCVTAIYKEV